MYLLLICQKKYFWKKIYRLFFKKQKPQNDFVYRDIEEKMNKIMGTKVVIKNREHDKGKIEIEYYSEDDLQRMEKHWKSIKG